MQALSYIIACVCAYVGSRKLSRVATRIGNIFRLAKLYKYQISPVTDQCTRTMFLLCGVPVFKGPSLYVGLQSSLMDLLKFIICKNLHGSPMCSIIPPNLQSQNLYSKTINLKIVAFGWTGTVKNSSSMDLISSPHPSRLLYDTQERLLLCPKSKDSQLFSL